MNPFLYIFYHFFKLIVRASLWVFYRRTTVVNRAGAKIKGPYIVAVNHPSTVLDPLNAAIHIPRTVHFLANASLFKTRFTNWFFNTFYCIPIERYQDTGGKPLNNAASFAKAVEFLSGGGCLLIAPEGSSYVERRVRKLKTHCWRDIYFLLPSGINSTPLAMNLSSSFGSVMASISSWERPSSSA